MRSTNIEVVGRITDKKVVDNKNIILTIDKLSKNGIERVLVRVTGERLVNKIASFLEENTVWYWRNLLHEEDRYYRRLTGEIGDNFYVCDGLSDMERIFLRKKQSVAFG